MQDLLQLAYGTLAFSHATACVTNAHDGRLQAVTVNSVECKYAMRKLQQRWTDSTVAKSTGLMAQLAEHNPYMNQTMAVLLS